VRETSEARGAWLIDRSLQGHVEVATLPSSYARAEAAARRGGHGDGQPPSLTFRRFALTNTHQVSGLSNDHSKSSSPRSSVIGIAPI
jgi:hypothetical protein